MSLKEFIANELSKCTRTTSQLSEILGVDKLEINTVLYRNPDLFFGDQSIPVNWSLSRSPVQMKNVNKPISTIVFVDLGNVHDCIKNLEPYASVDECIVVGFCDYAFTGYPTTERNYNAKNIYISRVNSPKKNAADTLLLWTCFQIISGNTSKTLLGPDFTKKLTAEQLTFLVVTKDLGFQYLEDIVKSQGHKLSFCKGWQDVKLHL